MMQILQILSLLLFIYLSINTLYLLIFAIAGKLTKSHTPPPCPEKKKIAVLITSYKEDPVIVHTVAAACSHNYPAEYFDVYLAADQLNGETILQLQGEKAKVHEVLFKTGSKAKSLNFLLNRINEDDYDIALVLDGDNIMLPGYLEKINASFQHGSRAFQGHRTAKNKNTAIAILDALSEEINNHLFRKAQHALGFSASTIGSGMAFEFKKLKQVYNKPGILENPACDREVDFEMMKAGIVVVYADDACLLDEKVAGKNVFRNQRRRWMESQARHLQLFFSKKEKVTRKTKDYWNKLFINLIPPRIIILIIFFIIFAVLLLQYLQLSKIPSATFWWLGLFGIYFFSLCLSIPRNLFTASTLKAMLHLPQIMLSYLKAATGMSVNRKEFIHTPKTYTRENNNLPNTDS